MFLTQQLLPNTKTLTIFLTRIIKYTVGKFTYPQVETGNLKDAFFLMFFLCI